MNDILFTKKEAILAAKKFKILANPTLIRVLDVINQTSDPLTAKEIARRLGINQSLASKLLVKLKGARLIISVAFSESEEECYSIAVNAFEWHQNFFHAFP
ncbi:MAG TPA: MarR family transcriptional regulator [Ktedonobacteraceae bacterium]|nr:MarR family transcriptional regulator [Ktedonobacteraceae bacterium]